MAQFSADTTGAEVVERFASQVHGKTFVITGPSDGGIGAATALALAKASPAALVLAGRTEAKVKPVPDTLAASAPSVKAVFVKLDLLSLASVREAAKAIQAVVPRVDVLINNGGIMAVPLSRSPEGFESQFAANHLGHFLLTALLKPSKVVNVSSNGHGFSDPAFPDDVKWERRAYDPWTAYGDSKLANILFAKGLAARGVQAYSLHPGAIMTNLGVGLSQETLSAGIARAAEHDPNFNSDMSKNKFKNVEEGCATTLVAALDPELENGAYLADCVVSKPIGDVSAEKVEKLWVVSEELVGEKFVV